MNTRTLGSDGLEVSALGLGGMGMSANYGPVDDPNPMIAALAVVAVTLAALVAAAPRRRYAHRA